MVSESIQTPLVVKSSPTSTSTSPSPLSAAPMVSTADPPPPPPEGRVVYVGDADRTGDGAGNSIRTTKYNMLTFIPRNLYEQFRRVAYVYFFILACLNQIPQLTVFGRQTAFLPLGVVLFLTAIKDGYEDFQRHRSDNTENNRLASVLASGDRFISKRWNQIRAGEIVRVEAGETIPCDLVLLATADPTGAAYVQTINLDGESNLKARYALQQTVSRPTDSWIGDPSGTSALIRCEVPNLNIYGFHGAIEIDGRRLPLGPTMSSSAAAKSRTRRGSSGPRSIPGWRLRSCSTTPGLPRSAAALRPS